MPIPKITWNSDNTISVAKPKKCKKITGTRFAAIMGLNRWNTPFKTWCEITKTYEEPFEDTIYTLAGKTIEPKQAEYMKDVYFMDIVTPEEKFGKDYFKRTFGDFFSEYKHLGGMWDYIVEDENGKATAVLEMKTTKRAEDWANDIPEYYAMQAALYAYLLGVEDVYMVASFLEDEDYEHPEEFECSADNTIVIPFKLHERYPNIDQLVGEAELWWDAHVETGRSPEFDEKKDADILKALRRVSMSPDTDMMALLNEAEAIVAFLDHLKEEYKPYEDRLKEIYAMLKDNAINTLENDSGLAEVVFSSPQIDFVVKKSTKLSIDDAKLKADGIYEKYLTESTQYILRKKVRGE